MDYLKTFVGLNIFWWVLSGDLTMRQILSGMFASFITILLYQWLLKHAQVLRVRSIPLGRLALFSLVVMGEILTSTYEHTMRIFTGHGYTEIVKVPLTIKSELGMAIIANAITLTPGSTTVELHEHYLLILRYKQCLYGPKPLVLHASDPTAHFVHKLEAILVERT